LKRNYEADSKSSEMLLFLMENSMQGWIKLVDDKIMDKGWSRF